MQGDMYNMTAVNVNASKQDFYLAPYCKVAKSHR